MPGITLKQYRRKSPEVEVREKIQAIAYLCDALHYLKELQEYVEDTSLDELVQHIDKFTQEHGATHEIAKESLLAELEKE